MRLRPLFLASLIACGVASPAAAGQVAGATVLAPPLTLDPGTTYRFGPWLNGMGSPTPYLVHAMICQIDVTITNANPGASPLDP